MDEPTLTAKDFRKALLAQNASNASGLIFELSEIKSKIWRDIENTGRYKNYADHPIVKLYTIQLMHLCWRDTAVDPDEYRKVIKEINDRITTMENDPYFKKSGSRSKS